MNDLSQIYFSEPSSAPAEPFAVVPVRNVAGAEGRAFLDRLRAALRGRGFESLAARVNEGRFHLEDDDADPVPPDRFLRIVEEERNASILFLQFDDNREALAGSLMGIADLSLLFFCGEISSLKECYLFIKELGRLKCGTDPVLLPVGDPDDPWSTIAPLRLAEAAAKFQKRKLSIWGGMEETASHMEGLVNRISRRREKGRHLAARKLAAALGG